MQDPAHPDAGSLKHLIFKRCRIEVIFSNSGSFLTRDDVFFRAAPPHITFLKKRDINESVLTIEKTRAYGGTQVITFDPDHALVMTNRNGVASLAILTLTAPYTRQTLFSSRHDRIVNIDYLPPARTVSGGS